MPIAVGQPAPDFTLKDQHQNEVKLSDFRGKKKVVLVFYPLDWSPVCTNEHACFVNDLKEFEQLDAQVLGISVDSRHSSTAFAEHLKLEFPLLSDFDKRVTRAYGVLREGGFAERALFVIDRNGRIAYAHINAIGEVPDNAPVFEVLEKLK